MVLWYCLRPFHTFRESPIDGETPGEPGVLEFGRIKTSVPWSTRRVSRTSDGTKRVYVRTLSSGPSCPSLPTEEGSTSGGSYPIVRGSRRERSRVGDKDKGFEDEYLSSLTILYTEEVLLTTSPHLTPPIRAHVSTGPYLPNETVSPGVGVVGRRGPRILGVGTYRRGGAFVSHSHPPSPNKKGNPDCEEGCDERFRGTVGTNFVPVF